MYNPVATSSCVHKDNPFIPSGEQSYKVFSMTKRGMVPAIEKKLLYHKVREPARTIDTVPKFVND